MTIVEFFDKDAIENIVSTLLCEPERVIFVGSKKSDMERAIEVYKRIAEEGNIQVEFDCRPVNHNDMPAIIRTLSAIVEECGECTFDLTGGEDLYLAAVGAVFHNYPDKVQLHRFNIRNGRLYDCDADGRVEETVRDSISCGELIGAFGGRIVTCEDKPNGTFTWDYTEDFKEDIWAMWRICCRNILAWNTQINALDGINEWQQLPPEELNITVNKDLAGEALPHRGKTCAFLYEVLRPLEEQALISNLSMKGDYLSLTFKNEQVKRCLTKAGQILEVLISMLALEQSDDADEPLYDDVMTGVLIDWDGPAETHPTDVENEIDVVLMKGLMPVFVSCKNGFVKTEELYKFNTVADRFGGKYVVKVLIASDLTRFGTEEDLRARAEEMNICLVTGLTDLDERELRRVVQLLYSPNELTQLMESIRKKRGV